jgi:hypothetical protein
MMIVNDPFEPRNDELVKRARKWFRENRRPTPMTEATFEEELTPRVINRLLFNAHELDRLIQRAGGLLFGTMPPEEAFERLQEAERLIAEVRALASR